jgi:hypothetical protein
VPLFNHAKIFVALPEGSAISYGKKVTSQDLLLGYERDDKKRKHGDDGTW